MKIYIVWNSHYSTGKALIVSQVPRTYLRPYARTTAEMAFGHTLSTSQIKHHPLDIFIPYTRVLATRRSTQASINLFFELPTLNTEHEAISVR